MSDIMNPRIVKNAKDLILTDEILKSIVDKIKPMLTIELTNIVRDKIINELKIIIERKYEDLEHDLYERLLKYFEVEVDLLIAHTFRLIIKGLHTYNLKHEDLELIFDNICKGERLPMLIENTCIKTIQECFRKKIEAEVNDYMVKRNWNYNKGSCFGSK